MSEYGCRREVGYSITPTSRHPTKSKYILYITNNIEGMSSNELPKEEVFEEEAYESSTSYEVLTASDSEISSESDQSSDEESGNEKLYLRKRKSAAIP